MRTKPSPFLFLLLATTALCGAATADEGEIVRIPTPTSPRCINAATDEVTITLRRVVIQKSRGFITDDKKVGITVLAGLNADDNPPAKHPSVSLVGVQDAAPGQVQVPLEYPVASLFRLSQERALTKNMQLDIYLDRVRGANGFGNTLNIAAGLLSKLPIPANPYTNAANDVLKFANDSIKKESEDAGGELMASVTLQFDNRPEPDIDKCSADGKQFTGAIAVLGRKAGAGSTPIILGNLSERYCWRYASGSTYEVQYAAKPAAGCTTIASGSFKEVPNDYVMVLVSAAPVENVGRVATASVAPSTQPRRLSALQESAKLCGLLGVSAELCGVQ